MRSLLQALSILLLLARLASSEAPLDALAFGDESSAKAHSLELTNAALQQVNETAPLGEPFAVHITDHKPGGKVLFEMAVDPLKQNHLTVKVRSPIRVSRV